jgi:hypothetical protein
MRVVVFIALAIASSSAPASSQGYGQVCTPDGPPQRPVGSEDNNPGAGIGLNDDVSGRDVGRGISEAARIREAETGPPLVRDIARDEVGNDCAKGEEF